MDIKPQRTDRPYTSQQFFNWILTITVAFLLGKSCWSSEKANPQLPSYGYSQTAAPASATPLSIAPPIIRQDSSAYSPSPQLRPVSSSRQLIRGPRGGCYYINESGNKVYVDRSLCD